MAEGKTKGFLDIIKSFITNEEYTDKKGRRNILLFFLVIGIMMMLAGSMFSFQETGKDGEPEHFTEKSIQELSYSDSKTEIENKLKEVLANIEGVGDVHIFVNFESMGESKYAQNIDEVERQTSETDREGGTRDIYEINRKHEYVLSREGGEEKALLLEEKLPQVKGVLVVACGAENRHTQSKIVRAIQNVMDLPVHRIAVLPSSNNR